MLLSKQYLMHTVLITGAAKRIGEALTHHFAQRGWEVIIHCNNSRGDADRLSTHLRNLFEDRQFPVIAADFSDPVSASDAIFSELRILNLCPEVLINSASVFNPGLLADTSYTHLRRQMAVNFEAPFMLMKAFRQYCKKGCIVNILDTRVTSNDSRHAAYTLSKKVLMHLTEMAGLEWAPEIRVNAVAPGAVLPPPGQDETYLKDVVAGTPLKQAVSPGDLADAVWFLVNNGTITGQIIYCDGGAHLGK